MAKKNTKKATKPLSTEIAARPSGSAAKVGETVADQARALKRTAPAATTKPLTALAKVALQAGTQVTASKPLQAGAQQVQKAPAKSVTLQTTPTPLPRPPKRAAQPESPKTSETAPLAENAPAPATPRTIKVTFVLPELSGKRLTGKRVSVCGDFNGWAPDAKPMQQNDAGHWETTVELAPGRYEYKFLVNGEWLPDPLAQENVWNQHGTLNSVIEVRA